MTINALGNATAASAGGVTPATQKTVSKDEFLRLFVTQLQHQDPLSPMDGSAFTAQLAQFSSLEQLTNIGESLKTMLAYQGSLQNTLTANLVGRQVGFPGTDALGAPATKYGTVTALVFEEGKTLVVIDGVTKITPNEIKEIR